MISRRPSLVAARALTCAAGLSAMVLGVLTGGCSTSSNAATTSSSSSSGTVADGGGEGDAAIDDATVTCQNDSRVDTYVANLVKTSTSGNFKVTLVASDPAPPAVGTNNWMLSVTDGTGAPMSNAPITFASWMPDHGHGSSVHAVITPQANGAYAVTPVYLFMPGVWRITVALPATDAAPAEFVEFFFCIAG